MQERIASLKNFNTADLLFPGHHDKQKEEGEKEQKGQGEEERADEDPEAGADASSDGTSGRVELPCSRTISRGRRRTCS